MYSCTPRQPRHTNRLLHVLICLAVLAVLLLGFVAVLILRSSPQEETPQTEATTQAATPTATTETTMATTVATLAPTTEPTTLPTTEATEPSTQETTVPETTRPTTATRPSTAPTTAPITAPTTATTPSTTAPTVKPTESSSDSGSSETGHVHGDYYTIPHRRLSCTNSGSVYHICGKCNVGIEIDDPVNYPALGHDMHFSEVVPPTATSRGYTSYRCSRCAKEDRTDFVDPLPTEPEPTEAPSTQPSTDGSAPAQPDSPPPEN